MLGVEQGGNQPQSSAQHQGATMSQRQGSLNLDEMLDREVEMRRGDFQE